MKIDRALISFHRLEHSAIEVRYAGITVIPKALLSGGPWSDDDIESLREKHVGLIAEEIRGMSAHQKIAILSAVRLRSGAII